MRRRAWNLCGVVLVNWVIAFAQAPSSRPVHVIEVLADKDSRYKIAGERKPEITVKAGEQILLRITARKGKSWNRDGSIHGLSLLRAKNRSKCRAHRQFLTAMVCP